MSPRRSSVIKQDQDMGHFTPPSEWFSLHQLQQLCLFCTLVFLDFWSLVSKKN